MAAFVLSQGEDGLLRVRACAAEGPGADEGWADEFFGPEHLRALTAADCAAFDIWGRAVGPEIRVLDFRRVPDVCEWTARIPEDAADGEYKVEALLTWYNGGTNAVRTWEAHARRGTVWPPPLVEVHETPATFRGANMESCDARCGSFPRCHYWTAYSPGHHLPFPNRTAVSRPHNALAARETRPDPCRMFESVGAAQPVPQPERPPRNDRWAWADYFSGWKPPLETYYLGGKLIPGTLRGRGWRGAYGSSCRRQAHASGSPLTVSHRRGDSADPAVPFCTGMGLFGLPGRWVRVPSPGDCPESYVLPDGTGPPDHPSPPHLHCVAHTRMPLAGYVWQPLRCALRSFDRPAATACLERSGINGITIQGDSMSRGADDALHILLGHEAAKALMSTARKAEWTRVLAIRNFRIMWAQAGLATVDKTGPEFIDPEISAWAAPRGVSAVEVYMPSSAVHGFRQGGNTLQRSREFAEEAERYLAAQHPGRHVKIDFWNASNARPELAVDGMHYSTYVHYLMWQLILNALC